MIERIPSAMLEREMTKMALWGFFLDLYLLIGRWHHRRFDEYQFLNSLTCFNFMKQIFIGFPFIQTRTFWLDETKLFQSPQASSGYNWRYRWKFMQLNCGFTHFFVGYWLDTTSQVLPSTNPTSVFTYAAFLPFQPHRNSSFSLAIHGLKFKTRPIQL